MNDFQKALESLKAVDLAFIIPKSAASQPHKRKRGKVETELASAVTGIIPDQAGEQPASATSASLPQAQPLPELMPSDNPASRIGSVDIPSGKRRRVEREWPPVGMILSGSYFGTVYQAEVVAANKRLKSGKQLKLLNGPAKGKRFNSFTRALLAATARQRRENHLGRRNASNGWEFWREAAVTPPMKT